MPLHAFGPRKAQAVKPEEGIARFEASEVQSPASREFQRVSSEAGELVLVATHVRKSPVSHFSRSLLGGVTVHAAKVTGEGEREGKRLCRRPRTDTCDCGCSLFAHEFCCVYVLPVRCGHLGGVALRHPGKAKWPSGCRARRNSEDPFSTGSSRERSRRCSTWLAAGPTQPQ